MNQYIESLKDVDVERNKMKLFLKRTTVLLLSLAMVLTMVPMTVMAAASETVTITVTDSNDETRTLAIWTYDSENATYKDNATNQELAIVKDFTQAANLTGTVGSQSYDFTDIGALAYTGANKKPDCRALAVTTKGILLEDLYTYAGNLLDETNGVNVLESDNATLKFTDTSNTGSNEYTYASYWGAVKYYYPDWYAAGAQSEGTVPEAQQTNARVVPSTLAIKGYHAVTDGVIETMISGADDEFALRVTLGQQEGGALKNTDANLGFNSVKNVTDIRFKLNNTFAALNIGSGTGDPSTDPDPAAYSITSVSTSNGSFTVSAESAVEGETITVTTAPAEGYTVDTVMAGSVAATRTADNTYTFTMPGENVEVCVTFAALSDNWTSTTWAGGLDFSWYDASNVKTEYHITTPAQWEALAWICSEHLADLTDYAAKTGNNVTAVKGTIPTTQNTFAGVQFYLDNDIDMGGVCNEGVWSGPNYYPIGSQGAGDVSGNFYGSFYGSFDGQGHIVKNVYCNRGTGSDFQAVGLFGRIGEPDNSNRSTNPADYPNANANIVIENISVSGFIKSGRSVGGVVGKTLHVFTGKTITIRNCMNFASVSGSDSKGVGGIAGALWNGASVNNCANLGTVSGGYRSSNVGGVSGAAEGPTSNSYNAGTVTNTAKAANTGAVALNQATVSVTNCYALEGSAPGYTSSIVNGQTLVSGGFLSEANMKSAALAVRLNTGNSGAWTIPVEGEAIYTLMASLGVAGYPVPKAFSTAVAPSGETSVTPTVSEGTATAEIDDSAINVTENASFTVSVKTTEAVTKDVVSIPAAALTKLSVADEFKLEGNVGTINMNKNALSSITTQAGENALSVSVETKTAQDVTGVDAADLQDAAIVEINLTAGTTPITGFGGNSITISLPAGENHAVGKNYKVIEISANGKQTILNGKCVMENGVKVLQAEITGLSTFVGTASQTYSVSMNTSVGLSSAIAVNADVEVRLVPSKEGASTYNSYDFTLTYDSEKLTYKGIDSSATVDSTTTPGTLYIRGCGADLNCNVPLRLTFTAKAEGSAAVALTSAKVDEKDNANNNATPATITTDSVNINVKQPTLTVTTSEYLNGYTLVTVQYNRNGTLVGTAPTYDGQPMFMVKKVGTNTAYNNSYYYYVVKTDAYDEAKVNYATASVETIQKDGDVNGTQEVDVNDAQFVFNLYNEIPTSYTPTVKQFLAADANGDGNIDILDCAAAIAKIVVK